MTDLSPPGRTDIVPAAPCVGCCVRTRHAVPARDPGHTEEPVCTAFFASSGFAQMDSGSPGRFRVTGAGGASLLWMTRSPKGKKASLKGGEGSSEWGEAFLSM